MTDRPSQAAPHKRLKRYETAGQARFLTFSTHERRPLLDHAWAKDLFAERLTLARNRLGFRLLAWVVMPEHVHLVVVPRPPELTVTHILVAIKRPVARRALARLREDCDAAPDRFWQAGGGYDRNVRDHEELMEKIQYIHSNPVRRGLAANEADWQWSSARSWQGTETRWGGVDREIL